MSGQVTDDIKANLKFIDYTVEKIEFNQNVSFEEQPVEIDFHIKKDIEFINDHEEGSFNKAIVSLQARIFEDADKNNYPFSLMVKIVGFFAIENFELNARSLIETNTIAILFPYLRSLVTTITANANVNPLILPPINVIKLIQSQEKE